VTGHEESWPADETGSVRDCMRFLLIYNRTSGPSFARVSSSRGVRLFRSLHSALLWPLVLRPSMLRLLSSLVTTSRLQSAVFSPLACFALLYVRTRAFRVNDRFRK
jgi:hypothetical protein